MVDINSENAISKKDASNALKRLGISEIENRILLCLFENE
ncbi:unnamed protein product, partial [marine sediment metagenome]